MNELNLLFTAIVATLALHFLTILFKLVLQNKKPRMQLSLKFLALFGIEQYAFCEKMLCLTVKISTALIFIATFEFLAFEFNNPTGFYIAILCGITGIILMKYLFSKAVKIRETLSLEDFFYRKFFGFNK